MLAGHRPARRKGTALGGDALDVAPQFDFLGQQRGTGGATGGILVVDADGIAARQLRGRGQGVRFRRQSQGLPSLEKVDGTKPTLPHLGRANPSGSGYRP